MSLERVTRRLAGLWLVLVLACVAHNLWHWGFAHRAPVTDMLAMLPRDEQRPERGAERRHQIAEDEEGHRPHDDGAPVLPAGERGEDRPADRIGERESGDEAAGERDRDPGIRRDLGQEARNDEAFRRYRERSDGEPEYTLVHGRNPWFKIR